MKILQCFVPIFVTFITLWNLASCVPNWHEASDGRRYLIEPEYKYNWFAASHECERRNSQLVIIDSEQKNVALINLLKKTIGKSRHIWIGGNDEQSTSFNKNRPFYWSTIGQRFSYTYWGNGQPDNFEGRQHCVIIWESSPDYEWDDNDCTTKFGFICEKNRFLESCEKDFNDKRQAVQEVIDHMSELEQKQFGDNVNDAQNKIDKILQI